MVTECKEHTTHTITQNSLQRKAKNKNIYTKEKAPTIQKLRDRSNELQETY